MFHKKPILTLLLASFMVLGLFGLVGCGNGVDTVVDNGEDVVADVVQMNFSTFMPPTHRLQTDIFQPWADEVEERTEGRVRITIYGANELSLPDAVYDNLVEGVIDIGFTLPAYNPGRFPITSILEFPFLFDSALQVNLAAVELYPILEESDYKDVEVLWVGGGDLSHFLMKREINSLGDFAGLRVRSPSRLYNDVLAAMGATPVSMPVPDIYDALDTGTIEGTMMAGSAIHSYNFHEVIDYVYLADVYPTIFYVLANKEKWNQISPQDQAVMKELLAEFPVLIGELYAEEKGKGIDDALGSGVIVEPLSEDIMNELHQIVEPMMEQWIDEMEADGYPGREAFEIVLEFLGQ